MTLWRHPLVLAYFAALVPALVMAFSQPVWSLVDEAHHADFVMQLSHGVYPIANRTLIDPQTLRLMQSTGVYRAFYPSGSYPTPDLSDMGTPPPGMSDRADAVWMQRHTWHLSLESIQPPAYYAAMVPVWSLADALGGPLAAVYALRVANALIVATLAPMAVALSRLLVPARPEVAVFAAVIAALLPGLALNGTRVSNDTLAAAMGGLLGLQAVRWAGSAWTWRRGLTAGLLLGAGLLVKVTLAGLIPALILSAVWPAPGKSWRSGVASAAASVAVGVAMLIPWFALNESFYGELMPSASLRLSDSLPTPFSPALIPLNLAVFDLTYWSGEPWGSLPLAAPFAVLGGLVALMAVAGAIRVARSKGVGAARRTLAVSVTAVAGMVGLSLILPVLTSFEFVAPGRYAYPALPAAAALCALGIGVVLARPPAQRATVGLYATVALLMLAGGAAGLPVPASAGTGAPGPQARTIDVSAWQSAAGLTITVVRVAFDPAAGATWFEVTATNTGAQEVEWPAALVVHDGDVSAIGDYLRSTHMPGDLDPGQSVSGWLYTPLDPAEVHAGDSLRVRFAGVAPVDYRTIADIDLEVKVPA